MKVRELKPILKYLEDDLEVNFAIISNKKDNKRGDLPKFRRRGLR